MAFCRHCGAQVDDLASRCSNCGQQRAVVPPPPVSAAAPGTSDASFVASLLDFSFTSFVTTKLIKVIYALTMLMAVLTALIVAGMALRVGGFIGVVMAVIFTPVYLLLNVIVARVVLEVLIVLFRMAEHTAEIARQGRRAGA